MVVIQLVQSGVRHTRAELRDVEQDKKKEDKKDFLLFLFSLKRLFGNTLWNLIEYVIDIDWWVCEIVLQNCC